MNKPHKSVRRSGAAQRTQTDGRATASLLACNCRGLAHPCGADGCVASDVVARAALRDRRPLCAAPGNRASHANITIFNALKHVANGLGTTHVSRHA